MGSGWTKRLTEHVKGISHPSGESYDQLMRGCMTSNSLVA
jgi:hypothetical protein